MVHTFEPSVPPNLKVGYVFTQSTAFHLECMHPPIQLNAHGSIGGPAQNSCMSSSRVLLHDVTICARHRRSWRREEFGASNTPNW